MWQIDIFKPLSFKHPSFSTQPRGKHLPGIGGALVLGVQTEGGHMQGPIWVCRGQGRLVGGAQHGVHKAGNCPQWLLSGRGAIWLAMGYHDVAIAVDGLGWCGRSGYSRHRLCSRRLHVCGCVSCCCSPSHAVPLPQCACSWARRVRALEIDDSWCTDWNILVVEEPLRLAELSKMDGLFQGTKGHSILAHLNMCPFDWVARRLIHIQSTTVYKHTNELTECRFHPRAASTLHDLRIPPSTNSFAGQMGASHICSMLACGSAPPSYWFKAAPRQHTGAAPG